MEVVLSLSTLSPLTHLCPCEDRAHSGVPRPCRRCSSTSPGSGLWAVHARSPATQRLSGSTGPAQPEPPNLKGGVGGSRQGEGGFLSVQEDPTVGQKTRQILTHTAVPLQHPPSLAGAFETAECVQAVSVLAHSLHGALIDV